MEFGRVPRKINRSINWGAHETATLLRLLRERPGLICSSKANGGGGGMDRVVKLRLWREVAREMQILHPLITRSYMECQFRWKNLLRRAKKEIADHTVQKELAAKGQGRIPKPVARLSQQVLATAREADENACSFLHGVMPVSSGGVSLQPGAPSQMTANSASTSVPGVRGQGVTSVMGQRFPQPNLVRGGGGAGIPRLSKPAFSLDRGTWEGGGAQSSVVPRSMPHLVMPSSLRASQAGPGTTAKISHGRIGSLQYVNAGDPPSSSSGAVMNPASVENSLWTSQSNMSGSAAVACNAGTSGRVPRWHAPRGRSESAGAMDEVSTVVNVQSGGKDVVIVPDEDSTEMLVLEEQFPHSDQANRRSAVSQQQPLSATGASARTVCETRPHTRGFTGVNSRQTFPHTTTPPGRGDASPVTHTTAVPNRGASSWNQITPQQGRRNSFSGSLPSATSSQHVPPVNGSLAQSVAESSRCQFSVTTSSSGLKASPVPSRSACSFSGVRTLTSENSGCAYESSSSLEAVSRSGSASCQRSSPEFGADGWTWGSQVKDSLNEQTGPDTGSVPAVKEEPFEEDEAMESNIVIIKEEPQEEMDTPTEREDLSPNLPITNGLDLDVTLMQPVEDPTFSMQSVHQAAAMAALDPPPLSSSGQREGRRDEDGEKREEKRNLELANLRLQNECWQILKSNLLIQQEVLKRTLREKT